jgi:subfamily B ATP-binding cassette protein MsbA
MNPFRRLFRYVWPQWPRVVFVVTSALVVAALLSLSFITVIPLLKVMMGKEGLHGWIDRKTCQYRYGLDFYVPESVDFTSQENQGIGYYLLVVDVEKGSFAEAAGLRPADKIIGVADLLISDQVAQIPFTDLLRELAATDRNDFDVQLRRLNTDNVLERQTLKLNTPNNRSAVESLKKGYFERSKWGMKIRLTEHAQWAVGFLPREQTSESKIRAVIFIMLAMGLLTIVRCTAKFYQGYLAEKVVQVAVNHLREDVFAHLIDMPMGFFAKERPSDSVSRIIRDTSVMGQAIKIMLGKALREPLNAMFMLAFAMLLNWQLTLIFLGGAPFVLVAMSTFGKKMKHATRKLLMAGSQMLSMLQETMAGLKVVKVYNQQRYEARNFRVINDRLLKQLLKMSKVDAATSPILEVLGMAAGAAAIIFGTAWVTHGRLDSSEFLTLLLLLGASAEAVRKTSDIWNKIQEAKAAAERVFAIVDEPVEFEKPGAVELPPLKSRIEFKNIVFTYPGGIAPVLKGVNLVVQAGHNVAIVGPNGSGKTTLANLLPRFYDPDSGQTLIDGTNIRDVTLSSLRRHIGMVTQDMVTFHDTIAANIGYGKPDATREEIIAAAKRSFAHEFINPLPDGYDTLIGEHSTGLSGGQIQRIVIARAILKNPAILIFDEATSQVDADSEAKIHKAIEKIMKDRTSFIIAHRFSTVINADVIVVMDQGRIIAQGQHSELIKTCSLYQSLYETQLVKE